MVLRNAFARMLMLALTATLAACVETPPIPDMRGAFTMSGDTSVTVPFTFDDNRVFVEMVVTRADGSMRNVLAFVNMGSGSFVLSNALYRELGIGDGRKLRISLGAMHIAVDPKVVQPEDQANAFDLALNPFHHSPSAAEMAKGPGGSLLAMTAPMKVEAEIPSGLLQNFRTAFDYGARTLTLSAPDNSRPQGIAVPLRVNPRTGFATIDLSVDGKSYPLVIDNGGNYSAISHSVVSDWLGTHKNWLRSEGGVGESNLTMDGQFDVGAPVVKAQNAQIGSLKLAEFGAVSPAGSGMMGGLIARAFYGFYSDKAGESVDGWIGGNVLKSFRVTLDYKNGMSYWQQIAPLDTNDLDQVGITLVHWGKITGIAGIAKKNGADTVTGTQPGDLIVSIDGRPTTEMTRGALLAALHGKPGDYRKLVLVRAGKQLTVDVPVTGF